MPNRSTVITVFALLCVAFLWGYKQEALLAAWQRSDEPEPAPAADPVAVAPPPAVPGGVPVAATNTFPPPAPGNIFQPPQQPPRQNTLTNTLDSIRPGQVQPEQITQRNAYFEKLSQQLRDLQGGAPPPPGGPPGAQPDIPPPPVEAPPPYPGSFPPDGTIGAGFPDGQNPMAPPQADFDQQTPGLDDEEDEEEIDATDVESDADEEE